MAKKAKKAATPADPQPDLVHTIHGEAVPAAELVHLHPEIRKFAIRADALTRDPDNARLHTERNLRAVANSLRKYGQQPLLVQFDPATKVIKVGNGRHEVSTDPKWGLNWTWIAAAPSNLSTAELKAFALADNRTAELAEWNDEVVDRQLKELQEEIADFDAGDVGFDLKELDALLKGDIEGAHGFVPPKPKKPPPPEKEETITPQWLLIVKCDNEQHQAELIEEFERRGLDCTAPSA
jgi:hypothetical protein